MEIKALKPWLAPASLCIAFALLAGTIFLRAWVCEDAYITFRVIDNLFNGYGLRWNSYERVQVYTHPLWMLLHIPLYALYSNIFLVNIALSVTCAWLAIFVTLATQRFSPLTSILAFILPFALSKTLMDYATSGLENPLSFALFAIVGYVLLTQYAHPRFWFYFSLSVSLALFNRLDTIILYAPMLAYVVFIRRHDIRLRKILIGASPLLLWFAFALFYYGFALPNTKYAKLNTGLDLWLYFRQGWIYLHYLLMFDALGLLAMFSSLLFILSPRWLKTPQLAAPHLPASIALGIYAYGIYVMYVGGDYMAGRFWALPIFASLWLWYMFCAKRLRPDVAFAVACAALAAYAITPMLRDINKACNNCIPMGGRILNARHTFNANQLIVSRWPLRIRSEGTYFFNKEGRKLAAAPPPAKSMWYIGMTPYYAGAKVKVVDELGLADPLLARLPAVKRQSFYIGHFRRAIPKGYLHAVETGDVAEMPPPLARYYEKLRLITSGDLWDWQRLETILLFNAGAYDHFKEDYLDAKP